MKISNTILAVFQLKNEMSDKVAHKFMANLDYSFLRLWWRPFILIMNAIMPFILRDV